MSETLKLGEQGKEVCLVREKWESHSWNAVHIVLFKMFQI